MVYDFNVVINTNQLSNELGFIPNIEDAERIFNELKIRSIVTQDASLEKVIFSQYIITIWYKVER